MKSILLAVSLLLSSISFAGPSCIWDLESTEVKNINDNLVKIVKEQIELLGNELDDSSTLTASRIDFIWFSLRI